MSSNHLGNIAPISPLAGLGFQFGGEIHRSALLISPEGIHGWSFGGVGIDERELLRFLDEHERSHADFLLLGTGPKLLFPAPGFRREIDRRGLGLEVMDTSAACRTYNILIGEARLFFAGLLPA